MQHIPLTGENAKIAAKWKKKLFIAGGYLAVSFALLILVSYGQYRIKVEGEAYMPEAAGIEACLELDKNLAATVNLDSYLTDLQPGDSARTYASAYSTDEGDATALNHKMRVTIKNSSTMTTGEGDDQVTTTVESDLDLDYTLRIFSTPGRVPMQFIMIDGENNKYISKRLDEGIEYRFYKLTENGNNETVASVEADFKLEAANSEGNTYQIFVGWDNTPENATSLTDAAFRKEVELLELRAELIAGTTQSTIPEESVLQSAIPTPTPSPSPSPTPTPPPVPTEPVG